MAYVKVAIAVTLGVRISRSSLIAMFLKWDQWRNKVAVGPRASIPKGPPLPQKNFLKTASGKFWAPHSAGPQPWLGPRALHALHALLLRH